MLLFVTATIGYTNSYAQIYSSDGNNYSASVVINNPMIVEYEPVFFVDYAEKARKQKTIAWVLAGAGVGMIITGIIVGGSDKNDVGDAVNDTFEGAWLIAGGAVVAIASVPLFIISGKNRKKAGVSSNFQLQQLPSYAMGNNSLPSPTIGITLKF